MWGDPFSIADVASFVGLLDGDHSLASTYSAGQPLVAVYAGCPAEGTLDGRLRD